MKTLIIAMILIMAVAANAAPFLTCDPDTNCEYYKVYADSLLVEGNAPTPLNYDLASMTPGIISFEIECCNYWGCERTVNPYVSKDGPTQQQNLRVVP